MPSFIIVVIRCDIWVFWEITFTIITFLIRILTIRGSLLAFCFSRCFFGLFVFIWWLHWSLQRGNFRTDFAENYLIFLKYYATFVWSIILFLWIICGWLTIITFTAIFLDNGFSKVLCYISSLLLICLIEFCRKIILHHRMFATQFAWTCHCWGWSRNYFGWRVLCSFLLFLFEFVIEIFLDFLLLPLDKAIDAVLNYSAFEDHRSKAVHWLFMQSNLLVVLQPQIIIILF